MRFIFCILWLFIGAVSSYDLYLLIKFRDVLIEQNPIGQWLISVDNNDISLFSGCKMLGTIIALGILTIIFSYNKKLGLIITSVISVFQLILLFYLTIY
jgi:hypothetical protein